MATVTTHGVRAHSYQIGSAGVDVDALVTDLNSSVRGEVRFSAGDRALYANDSSNYRQVPIGVVIPKDLDDVVAAVAACHKHGAPVLPRGAGTSLSGESCNVAVIIDFSKYLNHLLELNPDKKSARIEPGIIFDDLRNAAEQHKLTCATDTSTHQWATIGGMIGNNSCGIHSVMGGRTSDNIEEMEILTYDGVRMRVGETPPEELERIIREGGRRGEIYAKLKDLADRYGDLIRERFPDIPRLVSGYGLDWLLPEKGFNVARALVGTEGTCVTVLDATTRLLYNPPVRSLLVLGYPDIYSAGDHGHEILQHGPTALEAVDDRLVNNMKIKGLHPSDVELLPEGKGWLLIEFGGESKQESDDKAREVMEILKKADNPPSMKLFDDQAEEEKVWEIREAGLGATAKVPGQPDTHPGWEDSAVPPDKVGPYLRDLRKLYDKYGYQAALYGHFGQGCIHTRIDFDLKTAEGIKRFRSFLDEAADVVVGYGGSLSGEHGDGQARAALLPKMFGPELVEAFREFKSIWDPDWKMNPGKVVDPYTPTQNLRLGTSYNPPEVKTHFKFPEDEGSFGKAALRCVGVGQCRRTKATTPGGSTMCPSFMVTREEEHTTRGRARLLFEMMQGDPLTRGWREEKVKEALDLCLACKGCKHDCPVNVDMATYKAEFLSHYYKGKLRPMAAYSMGLIYWWSRLASLAPSVANLFSQTPVLRDVMKLAGGIAPQRQLPPFAPQTFKAWFRERGERNQGGSRVILFPDTFNNYFHVDTAKAAVEVLERAGYHVTIPGPSLCCGRPLYDYGMLDLAERLWHRTLDVLRDDIRDGVPVVGLEPSCIAAFRDELVNLFPQDEDANRLSQQTYMLSEFLEKEGYEPPKLKRKAIVHGHCHHKAVMQLSSEEKLLQQMGLDYELLPSGCCGMAGSFGFERGERYDVSVKVGENALLPAVRKAEDSTLVINDGFSCRTQISELTDRRALHLAQVIQMALHEGESGSPGGRPEEAFPEPKFSTGQRLRAAALVGAGALLGGGVLRQLSKRVLS